MSLLLNLLIVAATAASPASRGEGRFEYDPADETVRARMIGGETCHDPHVLSRGDTLWFTWLEFEPGQGDRIWLGRRTAAGCPGVEASESSVSADEGWISRRCITPDPAVYQNPTLTADKEGGFWLTYEQQQGAKWSVAALRISEEGTVSGRKTNQGETPEALILGKGINHRTASDPQGGCWLVWQAATKGRFDIVAARLTNDGLSQLEPVGKLRGVNDWQPDVTVLPNGEVRVIWDAHEDPDSGFNVYVCSRRKGEWQAERAVAATNAFEGRARITIDQAGRVWALWEEGNENWGKRYIPRMRKLNQEYLEITDRNGPLHAFRRLNLVRLTGDSAGSPLSPPLPMPAFKKLLQRPNAPKGVERLGGYYERGELAVDGLGRLWVVYRHYFVPWLGLEKTTHVQEDWGVYARCFDGRRWSKLFRCDIGQGDGMQRLTVASLEDGVALAYTTGRTDRRPNNAPRGMAAAIIRTAGQPYAADADAGIKEFAGRLAEPIKPAAAPPGEYQLVFGDLHRHTDLSLCFVPTDGTMDDAYRFAIDVARLDFLGITDHCRDLAQGDARSLLWWRCRKEVSRHDLSPNFIPMHAYERSRGGEDHNVVSLRPDMLRTFTYPHAEFWKELDGDTLTIPHQTMCKDIPANGEMPFGLNARTWDVRDDVHRPLLEIYQGCRDRSIERDAHFGLGKRHIFGFIASSDHLSTSASFAGVWTPERSREAIFRAMQARRTFGATDRIQLKVTSGGHWMGEKLTAPELGPVQVEAEGTATIQSLEVIVDGAVRQTLRQHAENINVGLNLPPYTGDTGIHYFYVRLRQADGNQAWSSPIWIQTGGAPD